MGRVHLWTGALNAELKVQMCRTNVVQTCGAHVTSCPVDNWGIAGG